MKNYFYIFLLFNIFICNNISAQSPKVISVQQGYIEKNISEFNDVQYLIINGNITENDISILKVLKQLKKLDLKNTIIFDNNNSISNRIPSKAFNNLKFLEEIVLPQNIEYIGEYAFANCTSLKTIKLPKSLKEIEEYAFSYCYELDSIIIPFQISNIKIGTFNYCTKLSYIYLNENVKYEYGVDYPISIEYSFIDSYPFFDVDKKNPILNSSYGVLFFKNNTILKLPKTTDILQITKNINNINDEVFKNIDSISVEKGNDVFKFENNSLIENSWQIYGYCSALRFVSKNYKGKYVVPDTITKISNFAFANCNLIDTIVIPSNINNIDIFAFANSQNLKKIIVENSFFNSYYLFEQCEFENYKRPYFDIYPVLERHNRFIPRFFWNKKNKEKKTIIKSIDLIEFIPAL